MMLMVVDNCMHIMCPFSSNTTSHLSLLTIYYTLDAVGAIITAMQYNPVDGSPTTFNIGSGEMSNLASLADGIQELADVEFHRTPTKDVIDVEQSSAARAASLSSNDYLGWSATTSLKDGAASIFL